MAQSLWARATDRRALACVLLLGAATLILLSSLTVQAQEDAPQMAVLDPRGTLPDIERTPLADRLQTLKGARIAIIKSWPDNSGFDLALPKFEQHLQALGATVQTLMDLQAGGALVAINED